MIHQGSLIVVGLVYGSVFQGEYHDNPGAFRGTISSLEPICVFTQYPNTHHPRTRAKGQGKKGINNTQIKHR